MAATSKAISFGRWIVMVLPTAFAGLAGLVVACIFALTAAAGTLTTHEVPSLALGAPIRATIYRPGTPPPDRGWPVLYLLHGLGGDETNWARLGHIGETLDRMIAAGEIRPFLVVMPAAGNSWYLDSTGVGGPGNFQTALMRDLPDWVEAEFPVRVDRGGRAIAGLSMGGYGALRFGLLQPERYAAVAVLSGAIWQNVPDDALDTAPDRLKLLAETTFFHREDPTTVEGGRVLPPPGQHFSGAYGSPFDARFFNGTNVFTLLARRIGTSATLPAIYLTVGDDDSHQLWRGAIAFYETMQADSQDSDLRITDGDHTWSLWRETIVDALKFIDGQIEH